MKKFISILLFIFGIVTLSNAYDFNSKSIIYNTEYCYLTDDYAPWKSNSIQTILKSDHKDVVGIKGESLERYKLKDKRVELFYSTAFLDDFSWQIDYTFAQNGIIVPKDIIHNKISYNVKDLFGISYGLKNSKYKNDSKSQTQDVELEKYKNDRYSISQLRNAINAKKQKIVGEEELEFEVVQVPDYNRICNKDLVMQVLNCLKDRELSIVKMRFGLDDYDPHTFKEIDKKLGCDSEQIMRASFIKLRAKFRFEDLLEVFRWS